MNQGSFPWTFFWALHVLIQIALVVRVLLRHHRQPASRIAWITVIIAMFVQWVKDHPQYWNVVPVETEFRFLTEIWPCER